MFYFVGEKIPDFTSKKRLDGIQIISKKQQAKFATKKMTQNEFKPFFG